MNQILRLVLFFFIISIHVAAQPPDSLSRMLEQAHTERYLNSVDAQVSGLNGQLTARSQRYLQSIAAEESKLKATLGKTNPDAANSLFGDVEARYDRLRATVVKDGSPGIPGAMPGLPSGSLDSIKNTLLFLQANKERLSGAQIRQLTTSLANVQLLESRLQAVTNLQTVLQQRQQYLSQQLAGFGMAGQLGKMNQTVYYYKQQIGDWKTSLQDPSRLQQKAIGVLAQLPAYKQFLAQHSYMSRLFGQPDSYNLTDSGMKGLQTRAIVQKMIQEKMAPGGPGAANQVSQQVQQASAAVSQLQTKLAGGGSNQPDPGFTPNSQKTKSLWKRLVYGANMQFEPATTLLPTLADMALSLGYRLNDKATVGVGAAWKMGLGNGIRRIQFSGQGLGLRSYIDWKWKKNLYLSGGYEENYLAAFRSLDQLRARTGWQKSGLVGLSREYQVSRKVKGKAQLLFDFLSFNQIPKAQPVVFRVGWSF